MRCLFLLALFPTLARELSLPNQFTECPNISYTIVPLLMLLSFAMPPSPHLLGLCLLKNHPVLSPFLHLFAWTRCPCHCYKLSSVKAHHTKVVGEIVCITHGLYTLGEGIVLIHL